jgi:hypothetical protein
LGVRVSVESGHSKSVRVDLLILSPVDHSVP